MQYWDTEAVEKEIWADKYTLTVVPKKTALGKLAPASAADVSGEYAAYRFCGYKDGTVLFEIDPFNRKCVVDGVDYLADVRKALGW